MERKLERNEITSLQGKATVSSPNYAILDKLKREMMKLKETKVGEILKCNKTAASATPIHPNN